MASFVRISGYTTLFRSSVGVNTSSTLSELHSTSSTASCHSSAPNMGKSDTIIESTYRSQIQLIVTPPVSIEKSSDYVTKPTWYKSLGLRRSSNAKFTPPDQYLKGGYEEESDNDIVTVDIHNPVFFG